MENSENKSIISNGRSNLAKTKKLLSITQKILCEIKPQYESVIIGNQEWKARNLDVDRFRNGDMIQYAESNKEWEEAGRNGKPAWCYYENDPENGKKYGKLYNWFAVNDPRGLAPEGLHITSQKEWSSLVEFLGGYEIAGLKMKSLNDWEEEGCDIIKGHSYISSGLNVLPGGCHFYNGIFEGVKKSTFYWYYSGRNLDSITSREPESLVEGLYLGDIFYGSEESFGAYVRCIFD
jgi:uncharacterized protein (TIGR02145 family)